MLVRDHPTLEVFMMRRTSQAVFTPGAYVFPGGAVDIDDVDVPVVGRHSAHADLLMAREGGLRWWAAAVRETFEESGLLLVDHPEPEPILAQREQVNSGQISFREVLGNAGASVATAGVRLFSHWLTPAGAPRRYDTWFFVAEAPHGQIGTHDNAETVASEWVTPTEMLQRWRDDQVELIFPTMRSLRALELFCSTDALLSVLHAGESEAIGAGRAPLVVRESGGERIALNEDERAGNRRGWSELDSHWHGDDVERADYQRRSEGAA